MSDDFQLRPSIENFNIEFKKQVKGFSKNARQALLNYSWPGNVRELSNCLERTMIFIENDWIEASDLVIYEQLSLRPEPTIKQWALPDDGIVLEDLERHLIVSALQQADNNKSKAARLLGLTRDTLRYRLKKYKLN